MHLFFVLICVFMYIHINFLFPLRIYSSSFSWIKGML